MNSTASTISIPYEPNTVTTPWTAVTTAPTIKRSVLMVPLSGGRTFEVVSGLPESLDDLNTIVKYLTTVLETTKKA